MSEIGPIISGPDAEQAVLDTLRGFLPVYLADRAEARGLARSKYRVGSYARSATVDTTFPNEKLPCVVAKCIGKTNRGLEGSSGNIDATFTVYVGVLIAEQTRESTSDAAWDYISAIEAVLTQQGSLGGFAEATVPGDTELEDVEVAKRRTLAGASIEVLVVVTAALNAYGGPTDPPDDPTVPLPEDEAVDTATVSVDHA